MIPVEFLVFELLTYLLFVVCFWHARRQGSYRVLELFFALVYGVFLEWMTIQQLEAYTYGHFLVMFDGAPLCIGLGWAVIIYSGMELVKNFEMPDFARPFLVGLLALNLDLAMDAVAIRLGFWHWVIPMDSQWFGVPWGNFWAWFIVVTSYSGMLYWLRARGWHTSSLNWQRWLYTPLAFIASAIMLAIANAVYVNVFVVTELVSALSMGLLVWAGVVIVYLSRPRIKHNTGFDWVPFSVPLVFHLYFNIIGFVEGFYARLPILMVVGISMLVGGLGIHLLPGFLTITTKRKIQS